MAVEKGGNVELSEIDKIIEKYGVKIIGTSNLPSTLATNASELYAKNLFNFLSFLTDEGQFIFDLEEEITQGTLIVKEGEILIN
jgi:NAD(P) transhydrogenase subunit alpha